MRGQPLDNGILPNRHRGWQRRAANPSSERGTRVVNCHIMIRLRQRVNEPRRLRGVSARVGRLEGGEEPNLAAR